MAIVSVNEIVNRRGRLNPDLSREYERTWRIETDDPRDGPATLLAWGGFAVLALPYSDPNGVVDRSAYCVGGIDLQPDEDDPLWWTATAKYSTRLDAQTYQALQTVGVAPGTYDPGTAGFPVSPGGVPGSPSAGQQAAELSPLAEPPEVEWGTRGVAENPPFDLDGKPFVNSAGVVFDAPPIVEETIETLTISRNELNIDHAALSGYRNTFNSVAWYDYPPKTVRCAEIKARRKFSKGAFYWQVVYEFEMKSGGRTWETKVLDRGMMEIHVLSGKLTTIFDASGTPVSHPVLLDGQGGRRSTADPNPAYWITFRTRNAKDFNALNLI